MENPYLKLCGWAEVILSNNNSGKWLDCYFIRLRDSAQLVCATSCILVFKAHHSSKFSNLTTTWLLNVFSVAIQFEESQGRLTVTFFFSFTFHFTESWRDESMLVASVVVSNLSAISCVAWKCSSVVIGTGCTHEEDCWMSTLGGRGDHSEWITMESRNSFTKTGGLDLAEGNEFRW